MPKTIILGKKPKKNQKCPHKEKDLIIGDLKYALKIVNDGYPYFSVPLAIRNAIKYIKNN